MRSDHVRRSAPDQGRTRSHRDRRTRIQTGLYPLTPTSLDYCGNTESLNRKRSSLPVRHTAKAVSFSQTASAIHITWRPFHPGSIVQSPGGGAAANNTSRTARHTAASLMLSSGVPTKVVSEMLGHSSPTITLAIYAHTMPGMAEDTGRGAQCITPWVRPCNHEWGGTDLTPMCHPPNNRMVRLRSPLPSVGCYRPRLA